jgi:transcriptional regulatory protein RtcR
MSENRRKLVVFGLLGTTLDGAGTNPGRRGGPPGRWEKWRPTVDLCRHDDVQVDVLELLHQPEHAGLAQLIADDVRHVSPATQVVLHPVGFENPWDFEQVYAGLHDFVSRYDFGRYGDDVDFGIHITTGTHTAQICWFLLAESRRIPAKLLQTGPPRRPRDDVRPPRNRSEVGTLDIIDLDLSRYDQIARRFVVEKQAGALALSGGIVTREPVMQALLSELEVVATSSKAPVLLRGETGVGKTWMARRIYELKKHKHLVAGPFVEVNCATLRGDAAMSTLFGHKKGSYTGAVSDRTGMLKRADGGVLFLDEIGELGLDEQAMLLKAIEDKRFTPMGADVEVGSDFQLVCGTHRDLVSHSRSGRFREDLLSRLDVWGFDLPALRERRADMADNLDVELARASQQRGRLITMTTQARQQFLAFATSVSSPWPGNFREFGASVVRMTTLCSGDRIDDAVVAREVLRLQRTWQQRSVEPTTPTPLTVTAPLPTDTALDEFDAVQLQHVLAVCRRCESLAEAGRVLFAVSRQQKKTKNDTDRLRKYLLSFGLDPDVVSRS